MPLNRAALYAVLVAIAVYVAGYFALTQFVRFGLSDTGWFSSAVLGGGQSADAADPFAAPTAAGGNVAIDAARENLQRVIDSATAWLMAIGGLLALAWAGWWRANAPRVAGPHAARSGAFPWLLLLVIALVVTVLIGVERFANTSLPNDLNSTGRTAVIVAYLLAAPLLFWLATAWPTPNVLRPSVPGGHLLLHRKR